MGKENIVYGRKVVREVIKRDITIEKAYICKNLKDLSDLEDMICYFNSNKIEIKNISMSDFNILCDGGIHQGIAVKISGYKYFKFNEMLEDVTLNNRKIVLVLDGIQDPRNLGSILRTSEIMGIKDIILPQKRSCNISSVVWKTSMGAVAHLNICRSNNLNNSLNKFKDMGFKIVVTTLDTNKFLSDEMYDYPLILVMGNEQKGVSKDIIDLCDVKVKIPMWGNIDSFNVSVAAGIVMYEIKNIQSRY